MNKIKYIKTKEPFIILETYNKNDRYPYNKDLQAVPVKYLDKELFMYIFKYIKLRNTLHSVHTICNASFLVMQTKDWQHIYSELYTLKSKKEQKDIYNIIYTIKFINN